MELVPALPMAARERAVERRLRRGRRACLAAGATPRGPTSSDACRARVGPVPVLAGLSFLLAPAGWGGTFGDFIGAGELAVIAYLTSRFAVDRWAFGLIVGVVTVTSLLVVGAAVLGLALFYADVENRLVGGYGAL